MNPSSLESQIPVNSDPNLNQNPIMPVRAIAGGRVINYITEIRRSIPNPINSVTSERMFSGTLKIAGMAAAVLVEGIILYGARTCKNDPHQWNYPCGTAYYSDDVGADMYAASAFIFPLIVTIGICHFTRHQR